MKIMKSARCAQNGETTAFVDRLKSIASRGKAEVSDSGLSLIPERLATPERPRRRFWTPEELAIENAGA